MSKLIYAARVQQFGHVNVHLPHIKNLGWILAAIALCLILGRFRGGPFR
ncbi:hypothetical protein [Catenulispora pinisilvae]|nr:hypothetical protein [Catenulispora pinisilvae]